MNIRNFCVISHIDHGKSTLADRFLELTGAVEKGKMRAQFLDSMDLERERGITIKMHPIRLNYKGYILNLIDTPGHIDFSYEISRALACVEGAMLLVDATKGIQAQTLFNLEKAKEQGLVMIGAVNKIDAATKEQVSQTKKELAVILGFDEKEIFEISAKEGTGVEQLLQAVIDKVPSPKILSEGKGLKALIFDSQYDSFFGVVAFVRIFAGQVERNDKISFLTQKEEAEVREVGYFNPKLHKSELLKAGEIGYIKTGIKETAKVKVGDTIATIQQDSQPLEGYQEPRLVLFLSLYPEATADFELFKDALNKLKLNDPALNFQIESKMALGRGFRLGFLGSLHAEITVGRLKSEFNLDLVATAPQVVFEVTTKNGKKLSVSSPSFWPDPSEIETTSEPWVELEIITPNSCFGPIFKLLKHFDFVLEETKSLTVEKSLLLSQGPLREVVTGAFYDQLKSATQGFASFSFKQTGMRQVDLVKIDVLIASEKEEAFSRVVPRNKAVEEGKKLVYKLKQALPAQQFAVALQAVVGGKIIARETISARRKDVTAGLYGGDITRKRKVLETQKKGKKKLKKRAGRVSIPAQVFLKLLK